MKDEFIRLRHDDDDDDDDDGNIAAVLSICFAFFFSLIIFTNKRLVERMILEDCQDCDPPQRLSYLFLAYRGISLMNQGLCLIAHIYSIYASDENYSII